ncbi:hypothetical protein ABK040_007331 [Willaertia magna]
MFSLFGLWYEQLTKIPTYHLLIIGEAESGKSELLNTLKYINKQEQQEHFDHHSDHHHHQQHSDQQYNSSSLSSSPLSSSPKYYLFNNKNNKKKILKEEEKEEYLIPKNKIYQPTIGQNTFQFNYKNKYLIKIWDIGYSLKSVWNDYFNTSHYILFLIKYITINKFELQHLKNNLKNNNLQKSLQNNNLQNDRLIKEQFLKNLENYKCEECDDIYIYFNFNNFYNLFLNYLENNELSEKVPIYLILNHHPYIDDYNSLNDNSKNEDSDKNHFENKKIELIMNEKFQNILFQDEKITKLLQNKYIVFFKHLNICNIKQVKELLQSFVNNHNDNQINIDTNFI